MYYFLRLVVSLEVVKLRRCNRDVVVYLTTQFGR